MRHFRLMNTFQNAIVALMANLTASERDLQDLKKMFRDLDSDKNGTLNMKEIKAGFESLKKDLQIKSDRKPKAAWTEREYDELWNTMDRDRDGVISYDEFIAAAIDKVELLSKQNIENTF